MEPDKRLRLFATAIALQQMHGHNYAQYFLQEQGIQNDEAKKITSWAATTVSQVPAPEFVIEFHRAIGKLLHLPEFSQHVSRSSFRRYRNYNSAGEKSRR
jgi:hypothetical protein